MKPEQTALVLIGYQNDYFAPDGILHGVIEESSSVTGTLANTIELLEHIKDTPILIVSTPIAFTADYNELVDPVGILQTIKEKGAFQAGSKGSETTPEIRQFGDRIIEVPGKRGLNAFSNTQLDEIFKERGITDVIMAGVVVSICIDSTSRAAIENGYKVSVLSDCTSGRTVFEHEFYCGNIFPLYANVIEHRQLLKALNIN